MKICTAFYLNRDHDLTADILPEVYLRCASIKELSFPWPDFAFERELTEIRAAWSARSLYVHFWVKDNWITASSTLGVFVQPQSNRYCGFEIPVRGNFQAFRVTDWAPSEKVRPEQIDRKWKSAAVWKTRKHDAGWVGEIRIPFEKDFGVTPSRGDSWQITFNRTDINQRAQKSFSTWSEIEGEPGWFHQPQGFGTLKFE